MLAVILLLLNIATVSIKAMIKTDHRTTEETTPPNNVLKIALL